MTAPAGPASDGSLWVFGYGSLMWRPGFAYARRCKATLRGWRRSLCVYSHVYRGSPERPGLVLGLDRGGACAGVAFEVAEALRETTMRYLREREQATAVYLERIAPITLECGERVPALTYVADRLHEQYAGASTAKRCWPTCARARGSRATTLNMSSRPTTICKRWASGIATSSGSAPG